MDIEIPKPPPGLSSRARRFWTETLIECELNTAGMAALESAVQTMTVIDQTMREWKKAGSPMMSRGSMGQEVEHPMLASLRSNRAALDRHIKAMGLPAIDEDEPKRTPGGQTKESRWRLTNG